MQKVPWRAWISWHNCCAAITSIRHLLWALTLLCPKFIVWFAHVSKSSLLVLSHELTQRNVSRLLYNLMTSHEVESDLFCGCWFYISIASVEIELSFLAFYLWFASFLWTLTLLLPTGGTEALDSLSHFFRWLYRYRYSRRWVVSITLLSRPLV